MQTKHAGQQSLRVRSDGRLLVTGGWDSRVRIYSTKTLKEMAVLKWHKEGVYATGFGETLDEESLTSAPTRNKDDSIPTEGENAKSGDEVVPRALEGLSGLNRLQKQREMKMQMKHWVAAGAKDGKVSLWEVF